MFILWSYVYEKNASYPFHVDAIPKDRTMPFQQKITTVNIWTLSKSFDGPKTANSGVERFQWHNTVVAIVAVVVVAAIVESNEWTCSRFFIVTISKHSLLVADGRTIRIGGNKNLMISAFKYICIQCWIKYFNFNTIHVKLLLKIKTIFTISRHWKKSTKKIQWINNSNFKIPLTLIRFFSVEKKWNESGFLFQFLMKMV